MLMTIPATNITFAQLFTMIFSGTFGLMGLMFLLVGVIVLLVMNKKRGYCTSSTEGVVSGMQAQFGNSGLRAVYSFSIDGKPMQYVSNHSGANNILVGQSVTVYYDPQQIGRVYIEEDARQMKTFSRVFSILGCVFLLVAVVVAVVLLGVL